MSKDKIKCNCGEIVDINTSYCESCGSSIDILKKNIVYCDNCETPNSKNSNFCYQCQHLLKNSKVDNNINKVMTESNKIFHKIVNEVEKFK